MFKGLQLTCSADFPHQPYAEQHSPSANPTQVYLFVPPHDESGEVTPLDVALGGADEDTRVELDPTVLLALVLETDDVRVALPELDEDMPHFPNTLWQPVPH